MIGRGGGLDAILCLWVIELRSRPGAMLANGGGRGRGFDNEATLEFQPAAWKPHPPRAAWSTLTSPSIERAGS